MAKLECGLDMSKLMRISLETVKVKRGIDKSMSSHLLRKSQSLVLQNMRLIFFHQSHSHKMGGVFLVGSRKLEKAL